MADPDFGLMLRLLHQSSPEAIADALTAMARQVGAHDVVAFLVDFEQSTLFPIPRLASPDGAPDRVAVEGTLEGRAFTSRSLISHATGDLTKICVPIFEGSDCTGVLALSVTGPIGGDTERFCEELGLLAGAAIAVATRSTDLFSLVRRRKAMSLPASIQWDLLPALRLRTPQVSSIGVLEPAYDVGGDCFDHSVNGSTLDVAIMDAMGHGLESSLLSSLAIGSYRHDRREGQTLAGMHEHLDRVIADTFGGGRFVTGQVGQFDVDSGRLTWANAGHPLPLHVTGDRVAGMLPARASLPWGLGGELLEEAHFDLQPGDSVVFYTDGVVEGRSPAGDPFGLDRFVDIIEAAAADRTPSDVILRTTINGVLEYQQHRLRDDASILWLTWNTPTGSG